MRALPAFAALLLLGSCKAPEVRVLATFAERGAVVFVAADPDRADVAMCWQEMAVVDDRAEPAWEVSATGLGECGPVLPVRYGRTPPGGTVRAAPRPLEEGRLYLFLGGGGGGSSGSLEGAFSLHRDGDSVALRNLDPDSGAAAELRGRWWARRGREAAGSR